MKKLFYFFLGMLLSALIQTYVEMLLNPCPRPPVPPDQEDTQPVYLSDIADWMKNGLEESK